MRYLLALLTVLVFAAPAQARYLHVGDARPAARTWATWTDKGATVGRCWHAGPHVVQCSVTVPNMVVCDKSQPTCELPLAGEPTGHLVAVIAMRRDGLYAHTLWVNTHSLWVAPISRS